MQRQYGNPMTVERRKLKPREKKVLFALSVMPEHSDVQVSRLMEIQRSTYSTTKRTLQGCDVYKFVYVPNPKFFDIELFNLVYGNVSVKFSRSNMIDSLRSIFSSFDANVFTAIDVAMKSVMFAQTQSYTDFEQGADRIKEVYLENMYTEGSGYNTIAFPFELSDFHAYYNTSSFFAKLYEQTLPPNKIEKIQEVQNSEEVTPQNYYSKNFKKETIKSQSLLKLCKELTRYPTQPNKRVADILKMSKRTVAKLRKQIVDDKIMLPRIIPRYERIGYEIMGLFHFRLKGTVGEATKQKIIKDISTQFLPILHVSKGSEIAFLSFFRDIRDFKTSYGNIGARYDDSILHAVKAVDISTPQLVYHRAFNFTPTINDSITRIGEQQQLSNGRKRA